MVGNVGGHGIVALSRRYFKTSRVRGTNNGAYLTIASVVDTSIVNGQNVSYGAPSDRRHRPKRTGPGNDDGRAVMVYFPSEGGRRRFDVLYRGIRACDVLAA